MVTFVRGEWNWYHRSGPTPTKSIFVFPICAWLQTQYNPKQPQKITDAYLSIPSPRHALTIGFWLLHRYENNFLPDSLGIFYPQNIQKSWLAYEINDPILSPPGWKRSPPIADWCVITHGHWWTPSGEVGPIISPYTHKSGVRHRKRKMDSGGLPNDPLFRMPVPPVAHECMRSGSDVFMAEVIIMLARNITE
jgi:hypothetical protein